MTYTNNQNQMQSGQQQFLGAMTPAGAMLQPGYAGTNVQEVQHWNHGGHAQSIGTPTYGMPAGGGIGQGQSIFSPGFAGTNAQEVRQLNHSYQAPQAQGYNQQQAYGQQQQGYGQNQALQSIMHQSGGYIPAQPAYQQSYGAKHQFDFLSRFCWNKRAGSAPAKSTGIRWLHRSAALCCTNFLSSCADRQHLLSWIREYKRSGSASAQPRRLCFPNRARRIWHAGKLQPAAAISATPAFDRPWGTIDFLSWLRRNQRARSSSVERAWSGSSATYRFDLPGILLGPLTHIGINRPQACRSKKSVTALKDGHAFSLVDMVRCSSTAANRACNCARLVSSTVNVKLSNK